MDYENSLVLNVEAEFVEIESYFTLHRGALCKPFDRSPSPKIQTNDVWLRDVMHQTGTSEYCHQIIKCSTAAGWLVGWLLTYDCMNVSTRCFQ